VAAATVAALALPFVLDEGTDRISPAPAPTYVTRYPMPIVDTDVDGDGANDTVDVDGHGTLSILLASSSSGTPLTADAGADGTTLVGLVPVGDSATPPMMIVTDDHGAGRIFHVAGGELVQTDDAGDWFDHRFPMTAEGQTWWVGPEGLLTGFDTGPIWLATKWTLNTRGKLDSISIGEYCDAALYPEPCGGGAGVVLPHEGQIALYPEATDVIRSGESTPIAIDGGGGAGTLSLDGSTVTVDFPGGSPAQQVTVPGEGQNTVFTTFMAGIEVPGIVVRQARAGGYEFYYVISWRDGELTLLLDENGRSDQLYAGDDQYTWFSTTGRLFTRWPAQTSAGEFIVSWDFSQQAWLARVDVTNADGSRDICVDATTKPAAYGPC